MDGQMRMYVPIELGLSRNTRCNWWITSELSGIYHLGDSNGDTLADQKCLSDSMLLLDLQTTIQKQWGSGKTVITTSLPAYPTHLTKKLSREIFRMHATKKCI
jgi:hypothetical protein